MSPRYLLVFIAVLALIGGGLWLYQQLVWEAFQVLLDWIAGG